MKYRALFSAVALAILSVPQTAMPEEKSFALATPLEDGPGTFLKHLLPRFTLKTGVRVTVLPEGAAADAALSPTGQPAGEAAFQRVADGVVFELTLDGASPHAQRFADWLASDVGQNTVTAYAPDGAAAFALVGTVVETVEVAAPDGDLVLGERLSLQHCGRCHVVSEANKYGGIGSTPSFGALRTIPDWQNKFAAFWTLNPHPSFTQVEGVTEPFDPERPPFIAPIELTTDEVDAIAAFAASIEPKDLGAPLVFQ